MLGFVAAIAFVLLVAPEAPAAASCASRIATRTAPLPAPIVVTTDCGRFRFGLGGHVSFRRGFALPVPAGASYFMDLTWYRIDRGRLTIGHGKRTLWRSRGRFERYVGMGAVASSRTAVAYAVFHGRRQLLFVATLGRPERLVGRGEWPLGFTRAGRLVTQRGSTLLLRGGPDWRARKLVGGAGDVVFDHGTHGVYFLTRGRLMRFDGKRVRPLARLAALRIGRRPEIEPLGRLVGVHDQRRLIVLRDDGRVFASTWLPRPLARIDSVSSALVADADADAVAFTATRGNTASGSRGSEVVYVLRPRATAARSVYRERLSFAVCERAADLSWRGPWLLYSASEGHVALIDTHREAGIDLSATVARLPGMNGDQGRFDVSWG
jgi:hypothetical protein